MAREWVVAVTEVMMRVRLKRPAGLARRSLLKICRRDERASGIIGIVVAAERKRAG